MEFEHLFAPGQIGSLRLRNRIVVPGMGVFLGDPATPGSLNEEQVAHWAELARGGAGLVFAEVTPVMFPVGATTLRQPGLTTAEQEERFAVLATRVHAHGAALGVQLVHHGKVSLADVAAGRPVLVTSVGARPPLANDLVRGLAPGELERMARPTGGKMPEPKEASEGDLAAVIEAFGEAAVRARRAGVDCVEIHAAHGYLISSFLSRAYNLRSDRWGGSTANRARLLCEVVRQVKDRAGSDYPVVVRIDGREHRTPQGITLEEACITARLAAEAGADAVHVSAYADPTSGVGFTDGPLPWREGQYLDLAAAVRRHVDVPVVAVGRILPERAEQILSTGTVDFVSMGRQLLADPELPRKLSGGRGSPVRPCINCFVCVATPFFDEPVSCTVNPRLGRSATTTLDPSPVAKKVVVAGGGPAGLECARVAARRGHRVVLLERSERLGGAALVSASAMPLNAGLVAFLEADARDSGVEVRPRTEATPALVRDLEPDVAVVATGAEYVDPALPGSDLPHVRSGKDLHSLLLSGWTQVSGTVVVVGGGTVGLGIAGLLAGRGCSVTVLEEGTLLGSEMAHPRRFRALHELRQNGVSLRPLTRVDAIGADAVSATTADGETILVPAEAVFFSTGAIPSRRIEGYRSLGVDVRVIGDAGGISYLYGAIRAGFDLGRSI